MNNVIDFPKNLNYKVLFSLPKQKIIEMRKGPDDDFEVEIKGQYGVAIVKAVGKTNATGRIRKVFPSCEIVEVTKV
tara:strand:+ start:571 stop:798 length:228 start_codon:yes stop_codon:yes gene_type:complete